MKIHIEKPGKIFKCDVCERKYNYIETLNRHKKAHTNKFECKRCKKQFNYASFNDILI